MEQTRTHWKKLTNPNYIGTYSLPEGQDMVLTIKDVKQEMVVGADGKQEQCVTCYFKEEAKPMIMNKTNLKMIAKLLGSDYIQDWPGHKIQIGSEKVRAFGTTTEALRVREKLPAEKKIKCEACGEIIIGAFGMDAEELAAYTKKSYGKELCSKCAQKMKEEQK